MSGLNTFAVPTRGDLRGLHHGVRGGGLRARRPLARRPSEPPRPSRGRRGRLFLGPPAGGWAHRHQFHRRSSSCLKFLLYTRRGPRRPARGARCRWPSVGPVRSRGTFVHVRTPSPWTSPCPGASGVTRLSFPPRAARQRGHADALDRGRHADRLRARTPPSSHVERLERWRSPEVTLRPGRAYRAALTPLNRHAHHRGLQDRPRHADRLRGWPHVGGGRRRPGGDGSLVLRPGLPGVAAEWSHRRRRRRRPSRAAW